MDRFGSPAARTARSRGSVDRRARAVDRGRDIGAGSTWLGLRGRGPVLLARARGLGRPGLPQAAAHRGDPVEQLAETLILELALAGDRGVGAPLEIDRDVGPGEHLEARPHHVRAR